MFETKFHPQKSSVCRIPQNHVFAVGGLELLATGLVIPVTPILLSNIFLVSFINYN